jgi:transcriptional regulator with XRE-family HTH domain
LVSRLARGGDAMITTITMRAHVRRHACKLSQSQVESLRAERAAGEKTEALAALYGISPSLVSRICLGKARAVVVELAVGSDAWVAREIRELARAKRAGAIDHDGERAYLDRVAQAAYAYEGAHRG